MIKQLQKLRTKRGFTMIELIVVIAIIAILAAMILPSLDTKKAAIDDANSAARDMYNVAQSIFTKYSLTEAPLNLRLKNEGNEAEKDSTKAYDECIRFYKKAGGNFPCTPGTITVSEMPKSTELYIEVCAENGVISEVNTAASAPAASRGSCASAFETLLQRGTATQNTAIGLVFKGDLESRMDVHGGYYYIRASYTAPPKVGGKDADYVNPVKVTFVAYSKSRLPKDTGAWADYVTANLTFTQNYINKNNNIIGVFGGVIYNIDSSQNAVRGVKGTTIAHDVYYPS